jgi:protein gp37
MNQTKIEWTDRTLNPVVGCNNGCPYCYARGQAKRQRKRCKLCHDFIPHPHLSRLNHLTIRQKPRKIFIDSMSDWNGTGVEEEWLITIIKKMKECSQHTFQILSKMPKGYERFEFPHNIWLGISISTTADCHRVRDLGNLENPNIKFVSIEPLHGKIDFWFSKERIDWLIIGAETGNRKGKIKPQSEWIVSIIENARTEKIPLFIKGNLHWPEEVKEYPRGTKGICNLQEQELIKDPDCQQEVQKVCPPSKE